MGFTLYVPTVYDSSHHFDRLIKLCNEVNQMPQEALDITVDFHYCQFLGHNGVAFLGGLARLVESRGSKVIFNWDTLPKNIKMNLAQNGFLGNFGCQQGPWDGNSIPYRNDLQQDASGLMDYLKAKWLGRGWVNVSESLKDLIVGKVWEIYTNAFEHSGSAVGVFSCGQHYPNQSELHLTVVDFGRGIPANVRSLPQNSSMSTEAALQWAFQPGTTTKHGIGRGLGLDLLRKFVTMNKGRLVIFSNEGFVLIEKDKEVYESRHIAFAGTLVNITFQCDESYYCLASEVSNTDDGLFF